MKAINEMTAHELDDLIETYTSGACEHEPVIVNYLGEAFVCVCHECKTKSGTRYTIPAAQKSWEFWKGVRGIK